MNTSLHEDINRALEQITPGPFTVSDIARQLRPKRRPSPTGIAALMRQHDGLIPPGKDRASRGIWQKVEPS